MSYPLIPLLYIFQLPRGHESSILYKPFAKFFSNQKVKGFKLIILKWVMKNYRFQGLSAHIQLSSNLKYLDKHVKLSLLLL